MHLFKMYGKLVHECVYTVYDCVVKFVKNVLLCEELLVNTTKFNQYMEFGEKEKIYHENSNICYICNNNRGFKSKPETPFTSSDQKFVIMIISPENIQVLHTNLATSTNVEKNLFSQFSSTIFQDMIVILFFYSFQRVIYQRWNRLALYLNHLKSL